MLKNNITASLVSLAIACLLSFLCSLTGFASASLPLLLMVTFASCGAIAEKEYAVISGALSIIAFYILHSDIVLVYASIVAVIAGLAVGFMIKKEMSVMALTIASAVGLVALYALYIFIFAKTNGYDSLDAIFDMISSVAIQSVPAAEESNLELIQLFMRTLRDLFPSIVVIGAAVTGYIVVFLTGLVLSFRDKSIVNNMGFSRFRADTLTTLIFIISMAFTIFSGYGIAGIVAENIYTILTFVLQVCGLSLLDWVLKYVKRLNIALRIIIILIVSALPFVSFLAIMAAMLDARRNFRGLQ